LASIRIDSLPTNGTLYLNGVAINARAEISVADINSGNLTFDPIDNSDADSSLSFSVSDGTDWSANSYTTAITLDAVADAPTLSANVDSSATTTMVVSYGSTELFSVDNSGTITPIISNANVINQTYNSGNLNGTSTTSDFITILGDIDSNQIHSINGSDGVGTYDVVYLGKNSSHYTFTNINDHNNVNSGMDGTLIDNDTGASVSFNNIEGFVFADGSVYGQSAFTTTTFTNYTLDLSSSLIDRDASETLSLVISGIPSGVTLSEGTLQSDGTWIINTNNLDYTQALMISVPSSVTSDFTITINATSTEANGGDNATTTTTVSISVNDAPTASNTTLTTSEDHAITGVLPIASDADGDTITYTLDTTASHGTVVITSTGVYTYTPSSNYSGNDSFTYTVNDSKGGENTYTVTVNVTPVADAPTLTLTSHSYTASTNLEEVYTSATGAHSVDVSSLTGGVWKTDNSGGTVEVSSSSKVTYGVTTSSGASTTVIELERDPGDASNLYTTMAVEKGEVYTLSFDYANRTGDNSTISIYWNGQLVATVAPSSTTLTNMTLSLISDITGSGKLEFVANDTSSVGVVLDNISLTLNQNTGYAGYLTDLPDIAASLTDNSETLSYSVSSIPVGYTLTDGTHTFTATTGSTIATITDWDLGAISLVSPSNTSTSSVTLTVTATSTESDGSNASTSQNVTISILADSTGYIGTVGDDPITGNNSANTIWGLDGNDTLSGSGGNDTLLGGNGNDRLTGGSGNDILDGGSGNDTLIYDSSDTFNGGEGLDTLLISSGGTINFNNIANGTIQNIEVIDLTQASVKLTNLNVDDVISMTDSDHTIKISGSSNDTVASSSSANWAVSSDQSSVDAGYTRYEGIANDGTKAYVDLQNTIVHTDF